MINEIFEGSEIWSCRFMVYLSDFERFRIKLGICFSLAVPQACRISCHLIWFLCYSVILLDFLDAIMLQKSKTELMNSNLLDCLWLLSALEIRYVLE